MEEILRILARFAPQLEKTISPKINETLKELLSKYNSQLQEGESCADILIEKDGEEIYVHVCSMSEDNKVIRVLERWESSVLLKMIFNILKSSK